MTWLRTWLRKWLGITKLEARVVLLQGTVDGLLVMQKQVLDTQAKLNAQLQDMRELKEMLANPKSVPVRARTSQEYRRLMQEEPA